MHLSVLGFLYAAHFWRTGLFFLFFIKKIRIEIVKKVFDLCNIERVFILAITIIVIIVNKKL